MINKKYSFTRLSDMSGSIWGFREKLISGGLSQENNFGIT